MILRKKLRSHYHFWLSMFHLNLVLLNDCYHFHAFWAEFAQSLPRMQPAKSQDILPPTLALWFQALNTW